MSSNSTAISPLRQAMIEEMTVRGLAPRTIKSYTGWVKAVSEYYGRSPSGVSPEEANAYLRHLAGKRKLAWSTVNQALQGLRFFYRHVEGLEEPGLKIPPRKREQRLPEVFSRADVLRLIQAHPKLRYRAVLHVLYGCGLRLGEAVRLRVRDIDSDRMRVRVEQGNRRRQRLWRSRREKGPLYDPAPGHPGDPAGGVEGAPAPRLPVPGPTARSLPLSGRRAEGLSPGA